MATKLVTIIDKHCPCGSGLLKEGLYADNGEYIGDCCKWCRTYRMERHHHDLIAMYQRERE